MMKTNYTGVTESVQPFPNFGMVPSVAVPLWKVMKAVGSYDICKLCSFDYRNSDISFLSKGIPNQSDVNKNFCQLLESGGQVHPISHHSTTTAYSPGNSPDMF